ncbi:Huntingtin interacting protein E-like protein [uncultured Candidatus Thioglobus sp.]|nr:Huntingtin interacting protein E-like protein [uncultured Candidatus Thioglobus sp.]
MNQSQQTKIEALKKRYYQAIDGKQSVIELIDSAEISEHIYNSNAIENSTLSLAETEKILLEIELDRYITPREIFEAKNLARVMRYISKNADKNTLNESVILLLHQMLISNIDDSIAGRFRQEGELVRVGSHIAPMADEINARMKDMLIQYHASDTQNIITRIATLHLAFEHTHPFMDGNGRIGRVINNYLLIRAGYTPINIKFSNRVQYYEAFAEYDLTGKVKKMETIVYQALLNSLHKRLAYLTSKKIIKLADYAKIEKKSYSNLLNKANRQTIAAFLEKGVWKIGV